MKKGFKLIVPSFLAIIVCVLLLAGSTFALFTSDVTKNISVGSATVNVNAEFKANTLEVYSAKAVDNVQTTDELAGIIETGPFAGNYIYDKQTRTATVENKEYHLFVNNASDTATGALLDGDELSLKNMTPGDRVKVTLNIGNTSNVDIKYRVKVNLVSGLKLFEGLKIKLDNVLLQGVSKVGTWTLLEAGSDIADINLEVLLPLLAGNDYQNLSTKLSFTVEAVQANAKTENETLNTNVQATAAKAATGNTVVQDEEQLVTVTVPSEAIEPGTDSLTVKVKPTDSDYNLGISSEQVAQTYDVKVLITNSLDPAIKVDNESEITVNMFIGTGLKGVKLYHNGSEMAADKYEYNSESGYITFKTNSFSEYAVVYNKDLVVEQESATPGQASTFTTYEATEITGVYTRTITVDNEEVTQTVVKAEDSAGNTMAEAAKDIAIVIAGEDNQYMTISQFRDAWNSGAFEGKNVCANLLNNVDISGSDWYPIGSWEFPFNGTFEGNNKTINGLTANSIDSNHVGLYANGDTVGTGETYGFFGIVGGGNTTIQNMNFTNVQIDIYNGKNVGTVVGYVPSLGKFKAANSSGSDKFMSIDKWTDATGVGTHSLTIKGINVSGNVKGNASVGGVAGKIYTSGKVEILDCTNAANVTGGSNTAGVVGYIYYSNDITVSGCTNSGTVKLKGGAGIVHLNDLNNKKITNNTNTGNIIYDGAYSKTSANSYAWDFIATGSHNNYNYSEYYGNSNSGKLYIQENETPEDTKGVLIVESGRTLTINEASEYTDVIINGTLNINANIKVYGCMWVEESGCVNINAELSVSGTQGYLTFKNHELTVSENGAVSATWIFVTDNFTLTNNGTITIIGSTNDPNATTNGLKKNNLTFINNGTFIGESNVFYGNDLNFTNNGTYMGNLRLTGNATIVNGETGVFVAHNGNGIDFEGGSGSFTNYNSGSIFGPNFDGISLISAGTFTVIGATPHTRSGYTLTNNGDNTYTIVANQ